MAIPDDDTLQEELLLFLASEPSGGAYTGRVYEELALRHPELTIAEKSERYSTSVSQWANRVQFARLHLVNRGLLFRANEVPSAPRGYWVLTPRGFEVASQIKPFSPLIDYLLEKQITEDIDTLTYEDTAIEGIKTLRLVSHFERNPKLRAAAVAYHGATCKACGFNFEDVYGIHGKNYIEVHHLVPVSKFTQPSSVNYKEDLTVLCSNCHRMIHRNSGVLSITELIAIINSNN